MDERLDIVDRLKVAIQNVKRTWRKGIELEKLLEERQIHAAIIIEAKKKLKELKGFKLLHCALQWCTRVQTGTMQGRNIGGKLLEVQNRRLTLC